VNLLETFDIQKRYLPEGSGLISSTGLTSIETPFSKRCTPPRSIDLSAPATKHVMPVSFSETINHEKRALVP
jgi:hypothetical protein